MAESGPFISVAAAWSSYFVKSTGAYSVDLHSADEQICSCFGVGRLCFVDWVGGRLVETASCFGLDGVIESSVIRGGEAGAWACWGHLESWCSSHSGCWALSQRRWVGWGCIGAVWSLATNLVAFQSISMPRSARVAAQDCQQNFLAPSPPSADIARPCFPARCPAVLSLWYYCWRQDPAPIQGYCSHLVTSAWGGKVAGNSSAAVEIELVSHLECLRGIVANSDPALFQDCACLGPLASGFVVISSASAASRGVTVDHRSSLRRCWTVDAFIPGCSFCLFLRIVLIKVKLTNWK